MPRTNEVTPYYIRTRQGETFYVDTLREALEEFLGDNGYRITFSAGGKEMDIKRPFGWQQGFNQEKKCVADITYGSEI